MHHIALKRPYDLGAFRETARSLIAAGIPPHDIIWQDGAETSLFASQSLPIGEPLKAPTGLLRLAEDVICHRDPERLALLYKLLWRLTHGERWLLEVAADPLVHRLARMQKAIRRDIHKMHAFVRFRCVDGEPGDHFLAWFEPDHFILERAAPFFVDRFAGMRWSIFTPVGSTHWNGIELAFGDPVPRDHARSEDRLEDWWRTYYRATFNPSRANPQLMRTEMPKRYWRNLPEARLIPTLLAEAAARTEAMLDTPPSVPRKLVRSIAPAGEPQESSGLASLAQEAAGCQRCPLHAMATQTVFGAGLQNARVMLVGEQPGDHEDLAGKAFVGPAGQLLDRALLTAGIERSAVYVTNAVKHFRFEPRGKRRIHKKPDRPHIDACRWWLDRELALVKPELVVALGATAAEALLGRTVRILSERGAIEERADGLRVLLTVHPSFLLRLEDPDARQREFAAFELDLQGVQLWQTRSHMAANESLRRERVAKASRSINCIMTGPWDDGTVPF